MKTARVLACCLLSIPLVGTVSRSVPKVRAESLKNAEVPSRRAPLPADSRTGARCSTAAHLEVAMPLRTAQLDMIAAASGGCASAAGAPVLRWESKD